MFHISSDSLPLAENSAVNQSRPSQGCFVHRFPAPNALITQTGFPVIGSYSFEGGACSGRVILRLSPGLFTAKFQACLHLSPLVSVHSGCSESSGPHDFALVSHLSRRLACRVHVCAVCIHVAFFNVSQLGVLYLIGVREWSRSWPWHPSNWRLNEMPRENNRLQKTLRFRPPKMLR